MQTRFSFLGMCVLLAISTAHAQDPFLSDYKLKWQNAMEYTLEFAQAMPEHLYDYRPSPEEMTFAEQIRHIAGNMVWLSSAYLKGPADHVDPSEAGPGKRELTAMLEEAFQYAHTAIDRLQSGDLNEPVDFFAGKLSRRRILFLMTDHVTHHRGQLVVYLRLNGIKPPRYRGW